MALTALSLPSQASATALPSTIEEDTTLTTAGSPYTGGTTIASGVTLKIKPGVELTDPNLVVKGTLKAEGSAEEPVVFDEEIYGGIKFEPGSGASVLDHVAINKLGSSWYSRASIEVIESSPTITNSVFANCGLWAVWVPEGGAPEIADNEFFNTERAAVYFRAGAGDSGEVNIHGNFVEGGYTDSAISVNVTGSEVAGKSLSGNAVVKNGAIYAAALSYQGPDIPSDVTGNFLAENKNNYIEVSGTQAHSTTWVDGGVPIRLGTLTIVSGVTLKVEPGVEVRSPYVIVEGTLRAEGTQKDPIVWDGGEGSGVIKFQSGSGASVIDHSEVKKVGGGYFWEPAIRITKSSPSITNSTFRESPAYAISVSGPASPTIEWNRFRRTSSAAVYYEGEGKLSAKHNDWGCANGPQPAGCGDQVASNIDWKPAVQLPELNGQCRGGDSQCPEGADPVSLATGYLTYSHRDLLLTNKSKTPLEFTRAYNSGSLVDTGLGPGWSQSGLASATELVSGGVLIQRQDGRQDLFAPVGEGYKAPSGVTDVLAKVEGTFRLTGLDGTVHAFDSSGRIATVTDDHGLATTYGYNGSGRLASVTDPSSQTLTFSYNGSNHITAVADSTGREVKFAYTEAGDLKKVTDVLGGVTEYEYDGQHRIKAITDPRENVILKNTYDGQGRVIEQRDGLNNLWKLEYKEGETIVTEPEGGELVYEFDGQGRTISEIDQLGNEMTIGYDAAGNVDEVVGPGEAKWELEYDSAGNLTSVLDPEGGEREYEYDGLNHLTEFTDERGKTWNYEWDEDNDLEKVMDPEEGETFFTYDPAGLPLSVLDAEGNESEFSYDSRGNRESATDPLEHETTFEYNARNHLIKRTDPGLSAEEFGRNVYGDLLSRTTPEGHKTEYAYDPNGVLEEVIDPAEEVWRIERNAMERPTEYVDPLEEATEIEYDGNLNPISVVDRRGKETTYSYDLANQLEEEVRPEGGDWEFDYDARGNRIEVIEPRENATTYEYDLLNRMTDADGPLGVSTDYEYDPAGNLTAVLDPRGNETTYEYDDLGRLEEIDQPLGKTTSFGFDGIGNLLSRTTVEGTLEYDYDEASRLREVSFGETPLRAFDYDDANRLTGAIGPQGDEIEVGYDDDSLPTSIDDGRGQSLSREYDSRGNLVEQVDPRGTLEYEYDELGRLSDLIDPASKAFGFEYDPEGNLTDVERPNGVETVNVYDNAGRLESTISKLGEATVESLQYEYDPAGNRKAQVDRLSQKTSYDHDALSRLVEFNPPGEGSIKYDYDLAGNRTEAGPLTYAFNALNQLTEASDGTVYDYDEDGRLAESKKGEETTAYEWDPFDNLAKVEGPGGNAEYSYDALGRLTERSDGSGIREAHYGDLTDLPTYDADSEGELTTGYVRAAGGLVEETGEAVSYPLSDAHGDFVAITGEGGSVSSRQSYDPWGTQLSGPTLEMGWLGAYERRTDPLSGLVQMGARSYGPELGVFLSEDPVLGRFGNGMSVDRYLYVRNNPLTRYDLNGRDLCVPTPLGDTCIGPEDVEEAAEGIEGGLNTAREGVETAGAGIGSAADDSWDWTAPGRDWISDRSRAFWKAHGGTLEDIYRFGGKHWQGCLKGAPAGGLAGATIGSILGPGGTAVGGATGSAVGCGGVVGAEVIAGEQIR